MNGARKFRKKPVLIEAIQVCEAIERMQEGPENLPLWFFEAYRSGRLHFGVDWVAIDTLEGQMVGNWTDWIIRGVQGELYPCKDEILWKTYDGVTE